jgi:hypothetical protein
MATLTAFHPQTLGGDLGSVGMITFIMGMIVGFNLGVLILAVVQISKT